MANKITKELYNGEVKIDFYPDSHRYKLAGETKYLTSVTAITGILDKSRFLIPWAVGLAGQYIRQYLEKCGATFTRDEILPVIDQALIQHTIKKEEAADIGSRIHEWCEQFAKAQIEGTALPDMPETLPDDKPLEDGSYPIHNGIEAFLKWFNENEVKFLESERMVYSKAFEYVGITDAIAEINGKKCLIDFKTGKGIYNEMRYQIAAYRMAYEEEIGECLTQCSILHFNKETGEFNVRDFDISELVVDGNVFISLSVVKKREKELANF